MVAQVTGLRPKVTEKSLRTTHILKGGRAKEVFQTIHNGVY